MSQILRDSNGRVIREINKHGSNLVIVDEQGNVKGTYNPQTNTTYDSNGNTVGTGNLLTRLL
jgi:hypothetical protein